MKSHIENYDDYFRLVGGLAMDGFWPSQCDKGQFELQVPLVSFLTTCPQLERSVHCYKLLRVAIGTGCSFR
jgi:hypothetical protein